MNWIAKASSLKNSSDARCSCADTGLNQSTFGAAAGAACLRNADSGCTL